MVLNQQETEERRFARIEALPFPGLPICAVQRGGNNT